MATSSLHELDFYAWTQQQVDLIKSGNLVDVDFEHVLEEIESMGASERRELISQACCSFSSSLEMALSAFVSRTELATHHKRTAAATTKALKG